MNSPIDASRPTVSTLFALLFYQAISILYFGIRVLPDPSHTYIGITGSHDPGVYMWFLTWWPYAITHHLNPFVTKMVWAPSGFNLTWATSIPLPALLAAPLTDAWGPIVTWNILCLVAPALAAWCSFIACRYVSASFFPALIGGYIFGFSPYMLGELLGHLSLILVFPVPLILYLVLLRLDQRLSRAAFVGLVAILAWVQFLCSNEVLATAVLMGAVTIAAALVLLGPSRRRALLELCWLVVIALGLAAIALSPFIYYTYVGFFNGQFYPASDFSSDLLAFFIPNVLFRCQYAFLMPMASNFTGFAEDNAYIGIPLLLLVVAFAFSGWRKPQTKLAILILIFIAIASLGPTLHIGGNASIPMPSALLGRLPLIDKALPGRFMMFAFLDLAVITSLYLSIAPRRIQRWILAGLGLVTLAPNIASGFWLSTVNTPRFFANGSFKRYIAKGEILLVLPYGRNGNSMLWQALTGMYFRMAEGYLGSIPPEFASWPIVRSLYFGEPCPDFGHQLKAFLTAYQVRTIILTPEGRYGWPMLLGALEMDRSDVDDVTLYHVPQKWPALNADVITKKGGLHSGWTGRISITSVTQSGNTITVNGSGFSRSMVINFFNSQGGKVVNLGGLNAWNRPKIPLTSLSYTRFEFSVPSGAIPGSSYVEALDPWFFSLADSGKGPGGAFTLK